MTENNIINIDLLQLTPTQKTDLQVRAALHKRHSNITFLIRKVLPDAVKITINQGKHLSENYATEKRLVEITKETFYLYVNDRRIHVLTMPYNKETERFLEEGIKDHKEKGDN